MRFTEREFHLIVVLISNAIEDTTIAEQRVRERTGVGDEELQAYLSELQALERRVVEAIETGDWAPRDMLPIDACDSHEEIRYIELAQEDLDALDAYFADADAHEEGLLE